MKASINKNEGASPMFSIIMPTYNREAIIIQAISSVVHQTFKRWELIIVDDGGSDGTEAAIEKFKDERIKYYKKAHEERSIARNFGIKKSIGKYICFLDSDDHYLENHLETFFTHISGKDEICIWRSGQYYEVNNIREPLHNYSNRAHPAKFIIHSFINLNSFCIPKPIISTCSFPENFNIWEDKHFLIRCVMKHSLVQIDTYTSVIKEHKDRSTTSSNYKEINQQLNQISDCMSDLLKNMSPQILSSNFPLKKELRLSIYRKYKGYIYEALGKAKFFMAFRLSIDYIKYRALGSKISINNTIHAK